MNKATGKSKITLNELLELFNEKIESSGELEWLDYSADGTVFSDDDGIEWVIRIERA